MCACRRPAACWRDPDPRQRPEDRRELSDRRVWSGPKVYGEGPHAAVRWVPASQSPDMDQHLEFFFETILLIFTTLKQHIHWFCLDDVWKENPLKPDVESDLIINQCALYPYQTGPAVRINDQSNQSIKCYLFSTFHTDCNRLTDKLTFWQIYNTKKDINTTLFVCLMSV